MRAVRFKIIKIVKEFVILHDCLSFSVFFVGITYSISLDILKVKTILNFFVKGLLFS